MRVFSPIFFSFLAAVCGLSCEDAANDPYTGPTLADATTIDTDHHSGGSGGSTPTYDPCDPSPCEKYCNAVNGLAVCSCDTGFWLANDGIHCVDIDECKILSAPCGEGGNCQNTNGSYRCICQKGYNETTDANGQPICVDVNECEEQPNICGAHSKCQNTEGGYNCGCNDGFEEKQGQGCVDIDECEKEAELCGANSKCKNTEGGYQCDCVSGYEPATVGEGCVDVNECLAGNPCGDGGTCQNTQGGYSCRCSDDYIKETVNGHDICRLKEPCYEDCGNGQCQGETTDSQHCVCPTGERRVILEGGRETCRNERLCDDRNPCEQGVCELGFCVECNATHPCADGSQCLYNHCLSDWNCTPTDVGDMYRCSCGCGFLGPYCASAEASICYINLCPSGTQPLEHQNWLCEPECSATDTSNCSGSKPHCFEGRCSECAESSDCPGSQTCDDGICGRCNTAEDCSEEGAQCLKHHCVKGWTCDGDRYGDRKCDCGCGVPDIDCKSSRLDDCEWKHCNSTLPVDGQNWLCMPECNEANRENTCDVGKTPYCANGFCSECAEDTHCAGNEKGSHCANGKCAACTEDAHCDADHHCVGGKCAECAFNHPCAEGEACINGYCLQGWTCYDYMYGDGLCDCGCGVKDIDCTSDSSSVCDSYRCSNDADGRPWPVDENANWNCKVDSECGLNNPCTDRPVNKSHCYQGRCMECTDDTHCAGGRCIEGQCIECMDNQDCSQGHCLAHHCIEEWKCWLGLYNAGNGYCDCGCGSFDPDCKDQTAESCNGDNQCPEGFHPSPNANWLCEQCSTDDECAHRCVNRRCVECTGDYDCRDGGENEGHCVENRCVYCQVDDDCPNSQYNEKCVNGHCGFNWHCDPSRIGDGICDCGCGEQDPDCANTSDHELCVKTECWGSTASQIRDCSCSSNINCPSSAPICTRGVCYRCKTDNECGEGKVCAPDGSCRNWTCDASAYNNGICDCGCGSVDPDCAVNAHCDQNHCPAGQVPKAGQLGDCTVCNVDSDCGNSGRCYYNYRCVECLKHADCSDGAQCVNQHCVKGWHCDPYKYADDYQCDYGCGAEDYDCSDDIASKEWHCKIDEDGIYAHMGDFGSSTLTGEFLANARIHCPCLSASDCPTAAPICDHYLCLQCLDDGDCSLYGDTATCQNHICILPN